METVFILTHSIMITCMTAILYVAASNNKKSDVHLKSSSVTSTLFKLKSLQLTPLGLYRAALGFLALFIR